MAQYTDYCSSSISQNCEPQCSNLITPGLEQVGVILNSADVNPVINGNIVSDMGVAEGKTGYYIYQLGSQPFNGTKTELVTGSVFNSFTHTVQFVILDNSPTVCENVIDQLSNGSFVAVLENKHKRMKTGVDSNGADVYGSSNRYQCYGVESGLKATAIACEKYSDETNSGWLVTLAETKATKSGVFFYTGTDEDTTTAFNALASPTVWQQVP